MLLKWITILSVMFLGLGNLSAQESVSQTSSPAEKAAPVKGPAPSPEANASPINKVDTEASPVAPAASASPKKKKAKILSPSPTPSATASPVAAGIKKKGKKMFVLFDTTMGKIKCRLFPDIAPKTVESFVGLAEGTKEWKMPGSEKKQKTNYYDGLKFHRVIPGFVIQGGDPLGNGQGGPGFEIKDEIYENIGFEKPGMLAMANRGPNTSGSQFFITTDELANRLQKNYTIFGEVVEGLDVVRAISQVKTGAMDKPLKDVVMKKVTIIRE